MQPHSPISSLFIVPSRFDRKISADALLFSHATGVLSPSVTFLFTTHAELQKKKKKKKKNGPEMHFYAS